MKIVLKKPGAKPSMVKKPAAPVAVPKATPAAKPALSLPAKAPVMAPKKPLVVAKGALKATSVAKPKASPAVVLKPTSAGLAKPQPKFPPKGLPKIGAKAVSAAPAVAAAKPSAAPNTQFRFLAGYCGRLSDPMSVLADSVATLMSDASDDDRADSLVTLYQSSQTLQSMLDDLRDFAALQTNTLELHVKATDCEAILNEVRDAFLPYAEEKGVSLISEPDRMPQLLLDGARFRKIVGSLVENSIRYTDRGTIGISLGHFGGKLKLTVEDTGVGIPPERLSTLFDPFVRLQSGLSGEGPGLGLALVRGLAERMGGAVVVSGAPGIGTSITVTIPNVRAAHMKEARGFTSQRIQAIKLATPTRRDANILVVDDSPVNLAFMRGMFGAMEFTNVDTASSGIEALEKVLAGGVDIVFTDIVMPGMNGTDLVREIRRVPAYEKLPVYAVTADNEAREGCAEAGFTEVLLKPLTRDKISRLIG